MANAVDVWSHRNAQAITFVATPAKAQSLLPVQLARIKNASHINHYRQTDLVAKEVQQRGLLTPLAEDASPPRLVTTRATGPYPESVARAVQVLKSTDARVVNAAATVLTEMSLIEHYVPAAAIPSLLVPRMAEEESSNEYRIIPTNPHGEPVCFVNCSAASKSTSSFEHIFGPSKDNAPPVRGLPQPHSTVRKSRRGLAIDCTRHEVPVTDLNRAGRAENFLRQMRQASALIEAKGQVEAATINNQWTGVDRHAQGDGFEVITVAATHRGDRNGLDRYYHRYVDTDPQLANKGPSHVGTSFAVATELQRNRLHAMQSRVLIPTSNEQQHKVANRFNASAADDIEAAAVMADPVEVPDEAFKITEQPAPTRRAEVSRMENSSRTIQSHKELVKRLNLGGRQV